MQLLSQDERKLYRFHELLALLVLAAELDEATEVALIAEKLRIAYLAELLAQ